MTTVNPNAAPASDASIAGAVGNNALAKTSADYNMFLKLLTTQMQNQDPLSPMDTSQYTQQLVQYSQVEQSIQQNTTLKDILGRLTTQDMAQSSSFIGREAQFDSNVSAVSTSAPALWGFSTDRPVGSLVATITDSSGAVVDTRAIDPTTSGRYSWDGTLGNGTKAPAGNYNLAIKGTDLSGTDVAVAVTSIGTVKQVTTANGVVNLGVNGADLPASALIRVSSAN
jgi:flagellar basal-body rod modification protein FlgD